MQKLRRRPPSSHGTYRESRSQGSWAEFMGLCITTILEFAPQDKMPLSQKGSCDRTNQCLGPHMATKTMRLVRMHRVLHIRADNTTTSQLKVKIGTYMHLHVDIICGERAVSIAALGRRLIKPMSSAAHASRRRRISSADDMERDTYLDGQRHSEPASVEWSMRCHS